MYINWSVTLGSLLSCISAELGSFAGGSASVHLDVCARVALQAKLATVLVNPGLLFVHLKVK